MFFKLLLPALALMLMSAWADAAGLNQANTAWVLTYTALVNALVLGNCRGFPCPIT